MPALGGRRRPSRNSVNLSWKNRSFRGYADFMQTKEFAESLLEIVSLIQKKRVALMCAEAVPWRCHRNLIADALLARRISVTHILAENFKIKHELTPFANIEGTKVSYPLFVKKKTQQNLTDFEL